MALAAAPVPAIAASARRTVLIAAAHAAAALSPAISTTTNTTIATPAATSTAAAPAAVLPSSGTRQVAWPALHNSHERRTQIHHTRRLATRAF